MKCVGAPGQKSEQITFKVYPELRDKISKEVERRRSTLAEFINDAVKHYVEYLENKRIDLWKMEKEKAEVAQQVDKVK